MAVRTGDANLGDMDPPEDLGSDIVRVMSMQGRRGSHCLCLTMDPRNRVVFDLGFESKARGMWIFVWNPVSDG